MARFFIDRPVFAWVIAIFLMVAGVISITQLPVATYPPIASPSVTVRVTYPGATAETLHLTVTDLISQELNGIRGLRYYEASNEASGSGTITATFFAGTDQDAAAVDVQNRLKRIEPRLPKAVLDQGVRIDKANSGFLCMVALYSTDGKRSNIDIGDYIARNVFNELARVPGVGTAQMLATEKAMRIWVDPQKLAGLNLSFSDVNAAIASQNTPMPVGTLATRPSPLTTQNTTILVAEGQLSTVEEFEKIILRADPDGATVRLKDVARVELGGATYGFEGHFNGQPSAQVAIQLSPDANALETARGVKNCMETLKKQFPAGIDYAIPFDTSPFITVAIMAVVRTLVEAIALVFVVMFLFLQNIRYTFIPIIVVPVAILGAFAVLFALGFSINVLTMFGMVLVIGILVDDAIVVVENVERIMREEHLPPREATRKAMKQITSAIVGMTLVLASVFIPMAFFTGAVGVIYRQFSMTMVAAILFSALLALTLTPALCANLLKPHDAAPPKRRGFSAIVLWVPDLVHKFLFTPFFRWFNKGFGWLTDAYERATRWIVRAAFLFMVAYAGIVGAFAYFYERLPASFLPMEDQGSVITQVQLPPGSSMHRTSKVVDAIEKHYLSDPAVEKLTTVMGFSFGGMGENVGLSFVSLKDWSKRGPEDSAEAVAARANKKFSAERDVYLLVALMVPPIPELGMTNGVSFRLQDRASKGHEALLAARNQLIGMMHQDPLFNRRGTRPDGVEDSPQIQLEIDRDAVSAMGIPFTEITTVLGTAIGSAYVNDFPSAGRMQRVIVKLRGESALAMEDLMNVYVRNNKGGMVPFSAFAKTKWVIAPSQVISYNGYPAMRIEAEGMPGVTSGQVMDAIRKLEKKLPQGFAIEWTKQALEESESGAQAPYLIAISLLFVFLLMAALYESWSIPFAVMLVVPIGAFGAVIAVTLRGMPNDIYFLIGMIAIIGLSAKNAILIIEFAKEQQLRGKDLFSATVEGARLRFRPILMTSFAFILGVWPLFKASGAASASQRAIGTGVVGGMLAATVLGVIFIPAFFIVVRKITGNRISHYDKFHLEELADERERDAPSA
ncbi:MAG: multidrug efflux RND transporter permease subunit [Puniceicoccales bacterium]|jgi:multidrug efflux pump|nr:multidrug efflux RND transporter permease subunit [Puniceicoccales bacterium]